MFCLSAQTRGINHAKVQSLLEVHASEPARKPVQALPGDGDVLGQRIEGDPVTWLNVDFVPDNRAAYSAMEHNDRHWEESQRLQQLAATADQYPIGSPERTAIMDKVIAGAMINDAMAAVR